jgi:UPF0755 protein
MKKYFFIALIVLILAFGWTYKVVYIAQAGSSTVKEVTVKQGMSLSQIADELSAGGVLRNKLIFEGYLRLTKQDSKIKAGTYKVAGNLSIKKLSFVLIGGSSQISMDITIPEGWNLRDIAKELIKQGIIKNADELYQATGYPARADNKNYTDLVEKYEFLSVIPKGNSLEGFLFPDTYRFFKNATLDDVLTKIFDNFEDKFEQKIKPELGGSDLSLFDAVTLASIIAREGKTFEDKKMIAGVFLNRLNIGMALQSDPTVNYVTEKVTDNPSLDDINIASLYNTYKNTGLPPGPIANPGLEDILAVLNPTKHNYFFFINTQDGKLIYSKSFEEHKANRIKYGQ